MTIGYAIVSVHPARFQAGLLQKIVQQRAASRAWLTIHEEVKVMADWFDKELKGSRPH